MRGSSSNGLHVIILLIYAVLIIYCVSMLLTLDSFMGIRRQTSILDELTMSSFVQIESLTDLKTALDSQDLQCLGWTQVQGCNPFDETQAKTVVPCSLLVMDTSAAGFCHFQNKSSGASVYVYPRRCDSAYGPFSCDTIYEDIASNKYIRLTTMAQIRSLGHRNLECVAWQQKGSCSSGVLGGGLEPRTRQCDEHIEPDSQGYCEFNARGSAELLRVEAQPCGKRSSTFRCQDLLSSFNSSDYTSLASLTEIIQTNGRKKLYCKGFFSLYMNGQRAAAGDRSCDASLENVVAGYCGLEDAFGQEYKLVLPQDEGFQTCNELLALVYTQRPQLIPITSRDQFRRLYFEAGFSCSGFRALDDYGKRRRPKGDLECNSRLPLPSRGWCQYRNHLSGSLFKLDLSATQWREYATCATALDWYWKGLVPLNSWADTVATFQRYPGLECKGHKGTMNCNPAEKRSTAGDERCDSHVGSGGGYCEYWNRNLSQSYAVMPHGCRAFFRFKCRDVPAMVTFSVKFSKFMDKLKADGSLYGNNITAFEPSHNRGIVVCVHERIWINAYALLKLLTHQNCKLPIEIWSFKSEIPEDSATRMYLTEAYHNVTFRELQIRNTNKAQMGYLIKLYSLVHSAFDEVLLLDADNYPVRNPTYLFATEEYRQHGAIFWPDFWNAQVSIFPDLHARSFWWDMVGLPYVEMMEGESGQVVADKRRSRGPLEVIKFFLQHFDTYEAYIFGDKDWFRFAWLLAGKSFYLGPNCGTAGLMQESDGSFCGHTMVQFDPLGRVLFMHRNMAKLKTPEGRRMVWQYVEKYTGVGYMKTRSIRTDCFEIHDLVTAIPTYSDPELKDFEARILSYAMEGLLRFRDSCGLFCWPDFSLTTYEFLSSSLEKENDYVPRFWFPAMDQLAIHGRTEKNGYNAMKELKAVLGLLVLDSNKGSYTLEYMVDHIERLGRQFLEFEVILLYESSVSEHTSAVIKRWQRTNSAVKASQSQVENRRSVTYLAAMRNELLQHILPKNGTDFVILMDSDRLTGWDTDGFANSFGLKFPSLRGMPVDPAASQYDFYTADWQVSCSNVLERRDTKYLDPESFRGVGYTAENYHEVKNKAFPWMSTSFEVDSCFGRVAIYERKVLGNCVYPENEYQVLPGAEIVGFHACLKRRHDAIIRFNPRQVVYWELRS